jgi:hypothetical protein
MHTKIAVVLDEQERQEVQRLLPSIALAFPERDDERSADFELWKSLRRLGHHDAELDPKLLGYIHGAIDVAADRLAAGADPSHWRPADIDTTQVPGSSAPEQVLAESAQMALRNLRELQELAGQAAALIV